jgi:hypothetical protein
MECKKPKINVLYPGRIEKGNLGDVIINGLLIRELLQYSNVFVKGKLNKDILQIITFDNPNIGNLNILNIKTENLFLYKLRIALYLIKNRNFDFVFDTPGHIAENNKKLKTFSKAILNLISIYFYKLLGIKSIKYGITLGPFSNINWQIYRIICKNCYKIVIRDSDNFNQLKIKKFKQVEYKPDLSFLLQDLITHGNEKTNKSKKITLSFRSTLIGKNINNVYFEYISEKLNKLLSVMISKIKIEEIDCVFQVDCDRIPAEILKNKLEKEFKGLKINFIDKQLELYSALEQYRNSEYVITNRLHVFLLSMLTNTKTFIVTDIIKHKKLISVIKDLSMSDVVFELNNNTEKLFADDNQSFKKITENYCSEIKTHLCSIFTI